jgi:hypothetical protein
MLFILRDPHKKQSLFSNVAFNLALLIRDLAQIVKNFKILVTRLSIRKSWHTGVLTKAVTFEISRLGALRS